MKNPRIRNGFSLTDVCVSLFVVAILSAAFAIVATRSSEGAGRIRCASNLKQIGMSILMYANENNGVYPRTTFDGADEPVPTAYTGAYASDPFGVGGPAANDVTSGLFLLLRAEDLGSEVFICSSGDAMGQRPWVPENGSIKSSSNFPSRVYLSYGYVNPYPSRAAVKSGFKLDPNLSSDFAIAADMGPGAASAKVPANGSREKIMQANSPNHGGDGQNVLYADGHAEWQTTPFCGMPRKVANAPRDNIFAFGVDLESGKPSAGAVGPPQDENDAVILPMADVGPQPVPWSNELRRYWPMIVVAGVVVSALIATRIVWRRRKRLAAIAASGPQAV